MQTGCSSVGIVGGPSIHCCITFIQRLISWCYFTRSIRCSACDARFLYVIADLLQPRTLFFRQMWHRVIVILTSLHLAYTSPRLIFHLLVRCRYATLKRSFHSTQRSQRTQRNERRPITHVNDRFYACVLAVASVSYVCRVEWKPRLTLTKNVLSRLKTRL